MCAHTGRQVYCVKVFTRTLHTVGYACLSEDTAGQEKAETNWAHLTGISIRPTVTQLMKQAVYSAAKEEGGSACQVSQAMRKTAPTSAETEEGSEEGVQKRELAGRPPFSLQTAMAALPK